MSVREIVTLGDPVLRAPARPVEAGELAGAAVQGLIDDLIDTRRAAHGAGLAAPQVGEGLRVAVVEVEPGNPRYPYKPPVALTVLVNPQVEPAGEETWEVDEGCLSVPGLRGTVRRWVTVRVRYLDRHGIPQDELRRGVTAGTFQHEADHLDGVLFLDRVSDPGSLATAEQWERRRRAGFEERVREMVARTGS